MDYIKSQDLSSSEKFEAVEDLFLKVLVLELLLAQHLATLLATAHQVRHDLLSGSERNILVNQETFSGDVAGNLIRETSQLTKSYALSVFHLAVLDNFLSQVARVLVVGSNEDHVFVLHLTHSASNVIVVALVS